MSIRRIPGSGTQADPYIISNPSELQAMEDDLDAAYRIGGDIDASGTAEWNNGAGFAPNGDDSNRFTGTFDGAGHTISGLVINRPENSRAGLFAVIRASEEIHNVSIVNASITGSDLVGGLVEENDGGTVEESYGNADTTGQPDSDGSIGLTIARMIGEAARTNMTGLEFGTVWEIRPDNYPALIALPAEATDDQPPTQTPGG